MNWINGHKTYIICAATLIYTAIGVYLGHLTMDQGLAAAAAALGAAGLRHGVSTGA